MKMLLTLCFLFTTLFSGNVVIVMGPSCGGKSTYAKKLTAKLNSNDINETWVCTDLDDIIDDAKSTVFDSRLEAAVERNGLKLLLKSVNKQLAAGKNIVVDTNMYNDAFREKINAEAIEVILVSAPLLELLRRDLIRRKQLGRDKKYAYRCWRYVFESYEYFFDIDGIPRFRCHTIIDSSK